MVTGPVIVAGAGVLGLSTALALTEAGQAVVLLDPAPTAASASSVAAGLIAPVAEALYDPIAAPHSELLTAAAALWPAFAARYGLGLARDGTWLFGVALEHARRLDPSARREGEATWVSDTAVPDAAAALGRMRAEVLARGGQIVHRAFEPRDLSDTAVIAVGAGAASLSAAVPELVRLSAIKGQIARAPQGPRKGPVVRWPGGYLAPGPLGARIGATMEPGRTDVGVELETIAQLGQTARRYVADLDLAGLTGEAGVRMATPDGLPLVGHSRAGPVLAVGARRNGWLLAPLVGPMAAAYVTGQEPGPWAHLMDPQRFEGA